MNGLLRHKEIIIPIELLNVQSNKRYTSSRVYTSDVDSVNLRLIVQDIQAAELAGATASLVLIMATGSQYQETIPVTSNEVVYPLTTNQLKQGGVVHAQVVLTKDGKSWTAVPFSFTIHSHLQETNMPVPEKIASDWAKLEAQVETLMTTMDQTFKERIEQLEQGADGDSAYQIARKNGFQGTEQQWLASLKARDGYTPVKGIDYRDGIDGKDGKTPVKGVDYRDGVDGKTPVKGVDYRDGRDGKDGDSAYQVALRQGFQGTEQQWLASLKGKDGKTPVKGVDYQDGTPGRDGKTPVKGIDFRDGRDGADGQDGKSAYELALSAGFVGTQAEWLLSLRGRDGRTPIKGIDYRDGIDGKTPVKGVDYRDGLPGRDGKDGRTPVKGVDYHDGAKGEDGYTPKKGIDYTDGKGAYELAVSKGFQGTEDEWLASLKGKDGRTPVKGVDYHDGRSAYELAVENGFEGTEEEWLDSIGGTYNGEKETVIENFCKFYGYPIAINGAWNVEDAAKIYAQYDGVVWGDGYGSPDHEVYNDTLAIARRMRELNPAIMLFGYVPIGLDPAWNDSSLDMTEIKTRIDDWKRVGATHIFLDEFGYDYYLTRERQNEAVRYCHDQGLFVCANGWNIDHLFSNENIVLSYILDQNGNPWEGNPNRLPSELGEGDYMQFENLLYSYDHPPGTPSVPNPPQLARNNERLRRLIEYIDVPREEFGGKSYYEHYKVKAYTLDAIMEKDQRMYNEGFFTSLAGGAHAYAASVAFWGANQPNYHHYERPVLPIFNRSELGKLTYQTYKGIPMGRVVRELGRTSIEVIWTQSNDTEPFEKPAGEGRTHIVSATVTGNALQSGNITLTFGISGSSGGEGRNHSIPVLAGDTAAVIRQKMRDFEYDPEFQAQWRVTIVGNEVRYETRENWTPEGEEWWVWHTPGMLSVAAEGFDTLQIGFDPMKGTIRQVKVDGEYMSGNSGPWWRRPMEPHEGYHYFDTERKAPFWYHDGSWTSVGSGSGGGTPSPAEIESLKRSLADRTPVNIRDFGARSITEAGYTTFDSTQAIQAAIDFAISSASHGYVFFPSGKYQISDELVLNDAIKIEGVYEKGDHTKNIKGTHIVQTTAGKNVFKFNVENYGSEISKLRLSGNGGAGIDMSGNGFMSEFMFENIHFNGGFRAGIIMDGTIGTISNCDFTACDIGIDMVMGASLWFYGNNFWTCTQYNVIFREAEGVHFNGNWFEQVDIANFLFQAPCSVWGVSFRDCGIDSGSNPNSVNVIVDGNTNPTAMMFMDDVLFENCDMTARNPHSIVVKMAQNTSALKSHTLKMRETTINYCKTSAVLTDYANLRWQLIDMTIYSEWDYGDMPAFTATGGVVPYIREYEMATRFSTDAGVHFKPHNGRGLDPQTLHLTGDQLMFHDANATNRRVILASNRTVTPNSATDVAAVKANVDALIAALKETGIIL